MGVKAEKLQFMFALLAVVGVSLGSLVLSQAVSVGAETDVGVETDVFVPDPVNPTPTPEPQVPPPAAPLDEEAVDDDGNDGQVGADANQLPSAGNGGFFGGGGDGGSGNATFYIVALFALSLVTGGAAFAYSRSGK